MDGQLPPPAPTATAVNMPAPKRRPLKLWQVCAMSLAGLAVMIAVTAAPDDDRPSRPTADAATCGRLQRLIDDGMTKREAIDYAIIQADEPAVDDILRDMLNDC